MKRLAALVLMSTFLAAPAAAQDDPAALVVRVQGSVDVRRGGTDAVAAAVGARIFAGDEVVPQAGGRAILITKSGAQQVVTQATTVSAPSGAVSSDIFARAVATLAQAAATDATGGGRQGMIRPIPGQTVLVAPRNALKLATTRPTFDWTPTPGKTYDLMLRKIEGGRPQIYEVGADTTWTLPAGEPGLEHGATYSWTVFVGGRQGGRPVEQQEFRVVTLEEEVDLQDYLDEISVFGLDPTGDGLFLTVVAYRDMDLFYDAADALEQVERSSSLSPDLYMLMGEILSELGHEEAARAAFDKADRLLR